MRGVARALGLSAALAIGAAGLCACSSGAQVSGMALFDSRLLTVGETVTIRLPIDRSAGMEWTVESYDSRYLGYEGRTLEMDTPDKGTMVVRFVAKTPGETTLTLRRRYSTGSERAALRDYTITILSR